MAPLHYKCTTPHYIQQLCVRWPLQPLQPFRKTQLQPPFGPSVYSLCQPWFTTTNLSYSFPIQNFRHHLVRYYLYTKLYQAINQSIYIYTPLTSSTISGIASNILGMLEHTGVSLEHTRITPRTYQEATNDYTRIDLKAIYQATGPRHVKTSLDWLQKPRQIKQWTIFLEMGMRSRAWVGISSETLRELQQETR